MREYSTFPFTTLQLAIYLQRNDLAMALLEAGAPVGAGGDVEKLSPLCLAVQENPKMVAPLLKAGADPKEPGSRDGFTPLHFAAWGVNLETAKLARMHNDANLVAIGARQHSNHEATEIVLAFLATPFSGEERHARRIQQVAAYENPK